MSKNARETLFPAPARRWIVTTVTALAALAVVLLVWRGPAILLDLAAMSSRLLCF